MNPFLTLLLYNPSVIPMLRRRQPHYCPAVSMGHPWVRMPFFCFQLMRKANVTTAVSPISLPRDWDTVNPGILCSVAGWGRLDVDMSCTNKLQEVELEVQRAEKCTSRYKHYSTTTQICVGDPRKRKSSFKVSSPVLSMQSLGLWIRGHGNELCPVSPACPPVQSLSGVPGGWTLPLSHIWAEASCGRRRIVRARLKPQDQQDPFISQGP